jgi:hypothetical protein
MITFYTGTSVLPTHIYKAEANEPFTSQISSVDPFTGNFTYHQNYKPFFYFDAYDSQSNPVQLHKANGINTSYIWGYNKTLPIAEVTNAAQNEVYHDNFEEPGGWDGNMTAYDGNVRFTGKYSGKIVKTTAGELYSHSTKWLSVALTAPTKYKYSGWVYSNGPSVDIFFFMKRANEGGYFSYVDHIPTTNTNQWVFLEKEFEVPADVTKLNIRVDNNGGGIVWFDDIRLHPATAQMTTYTYEPMLGITSGTDAANVTAHYGFDSFGRLNLVKDIDGNVRKHFNYQYRTSP